MSKRSRVSGFITDPPLNGLEGDEIDYYLANEEEEREAEEENDDNEFLSSFNNMISDIMGNQKSSWKNTEVIELETVENDERFIPPSFQLKICCCQMTCSKWYCQDNCFGGGGDGGEEESHKSPTPDVFRKCQSILSWIGVWFFLFLELLNKSYHKFRSFYNEEVDSCRKNSICCNHFCDSLDRGCPRIWRCFCGSCNMSTAWSVFISTYRNWTFFKWALLISFICFFIYISPATIIKEDSNEIQNVEELNRVLNLRDSVLFIGLVLFCVMVVMFSYQYMILFPVNPSERLEIMENEHYSRENANKHNQKTPTTTFSSDDEIEILDEINNDHVIESKHSLNYTKSSVKTTPPPKVVTTTTTTIIPADSNDFIVNEFSYK